jgi:hypothetical protein
MLADASISLLDRLTLRSSTLVAETGHQSGEEVGDRSDGVEDLFESAPFDLP